MKKLRKTNNIKASKGQLQSFIFMAIVGIIAFLMTMRPVAEYVSKTFNIDADAVQRVANDIVRVTLTIIVLTFAVISAPISGLLALVVGTIAIAVSVPVIERYLGPSDSAE